MNVGIANSIANVSSRIGLDHETALNLRIDGLIAWLQSTRRESSDPESNRHQSHSQALYERGERLKSIGVAFDSFLREYVSIQGFDPEFAEPVTEVVYALADEMTIALSEAERARR
jgi:hypothetical protein